MFEYLIFFGVFEGLDVVLIVCELGCGQFVIYIVCDDCCMVVMCVVLVFFVLQIVVLEFLVWDMMFYDCVLFVGGVMVVWMVVLMVLVYGVIKGLFVLLIMLLVMMQCVLFCVLLCDVSFYVIVGNCIDEVVLCVYLVWMGFL